MINHEVYMEIKVLYRQGKSVRAIARLLGVSRNTVRHYLRHTEGPNYAQRQTKPVSKLQPFYAYLQNRLQEAQPHWLPAKVCQPYRPQTKGKVERTIRYLRESFYLPWVTQHRAPVLDLALLNQASAVWLDTVANLRWHATLQAQPQQLLQQDVVNTCSMP